MLPAHRTIHWTSLHHFDCAVKRQSFLCGKRLAEGRLLVDIQSCKVLNFLVILECSIRFDRIRAISLNCLFRSGSECALVILAVNRVYMQIDLVNAAA